ncbi:hypothetical protein B566_EDAN007555 [Ephemera danica]|nr:hypothetical protein B566_EDAN007555 [Ephemera danica]
MHELQYLLVKAKINATSVVVQCYGKKELLYESVHLQVLPLELELDLKSKKALQIHGINVLIFCIDSISRLNFIRQLPKTYKLITQDFNFDVPKGLTKVLDDEFAAFITRLNTSGILKNTFMLLLGDHGNRFDDIRKTKIGRIEESMPFLGIQLPESLKYLRENVQKNLNILTSWHDVYETLMDVAMNNTAFQSKQVRYGYHGLSLFRPISADRTCSEIGIPQKYCICSYEKELDLHEPHVLDSAQILIDHVNKLLKPHTNLCAKLTLDAVISSQLLMPNRPNYSDEAKPSDPEMKIRILVSAKPSGAMLEGIVVFKPLSSKIEGEVNRINEYGNQSACIGAAIKFIPSMSSLTPVMHIPKCISIMCTACIEVIEPQLSATHSTQQTDRERAATASC